MLTDTTKQSIEATAEPIFKDTGISFAALATSNSTAAANSNDAAKTFSFSSPGQTSGFFGLSKHNDFSSFSKPASGEQLNGSGGAHGDSACGGEDPNYDPHYDAIIELPDEIEVRTGEEDEQKMFGERAKLFRYDATNREWKERGMWMKTY